MFPPDKAPRLPDWEDRLNLWLTRVAETPFEWGQHDCALFAAGAVEAMTGQDFAAPFRGRYTTPGGAARALKRAGFADVQGPFTAALGAPVAPLQLGRGDVCWDGENVGLQLAGRAVFVGDEGLTARPPAAIVCGWKV